MRLPVPLTADAEAPLARANPVAKLAAAACLMAVLFASVDVVTSGIVVGALVAVVPFSGLSARAIARRGALLWFSAATVAVVNILFAAQVGPSVARIGPLHVGADTAQAAVALAIRIIGFGLTGILAVATTEPSELADALVQQLRVPARFAVGALAAFRLVPVLAAAWRTIGMARRARGIDAGRSPVAAIRLAASRLLGLLVDAVRRGTRLALAMEARGFGAADCRTVARPMRMRPADYGWIAAGGVTAGAALAVSLALGTWRFLFG